MPRGWVEGWLARINGRREWPGNWKRCLVAQWRASWRTYEPLAEGQKKNAPPVVSANVAAIRSEGQARVLAVQVRELEDQVHQDRVGNMPFDAEKLLRLKALRAELAAARPAEGGAA